MKKETPHTEELAQPIIAFALRFLESHFAEATEEMDGNFTLEDLKKLTELDNENP
jgi:hypothetical protein